jgi:hypothetical protein
MQPKTISEFVGKKKTHQWVSSVRMQKDSSGGLRKESWETIKKKGLHGEVGMTQ